MKSDTAGSLSSRKVPGVNHHRGITVGRVLVALTVALMVWAHPAAAKAQTGSYQLKSVNGMRVPATLLDSAHMKMEMIGGSITLLSGGAFRMSVTSRITAQGVTTTISDSASGTYAVKGTAITAKSKDGSVNSGTLVGNVLTTTDQHDPGEKMIMVFEK